MKETVVIKSCSPVMSSVCRALSVLLYTTAVNVQYRYGSLVIIYIITIILSLQLAIHYIACQPLCQIGGGCFIIGKRPCTPKPL